MKMSFEEKQLRKAACESLEGCGVYADWLEERGRKEAFAWRWLFKYKKEPYHYFSDPGWRWDFVGTGSREWRVSVVHYWLPSWLECGAYHYTRHRAVLAAVKILLLVHKDLLE